MKKALIALAVLLVLGGGHYAYWHSQTSAQIARIDKNIAALNTRYGTANSRSVFAYNSASPTGWPLHHIIVLEDASLTQTSGLAHYTVQTDAVWISEEAGRFRLDFLEAFTGSDDEGRGSVDRYEFMPTPHPVLYLRTPEAQQAASPKGNPLGMLMAGQPAPAGSAPDIVYQFKPELSPKLRLDASQEGKKSAAAEFDVPAALSSTYFPLPASLSSPTSFLFSILGEMIDQGQKQPQPTTKALP